MNKCLFFTVVALSGSLLVQAESHVLPIKDTNGTGTTRDWTNTDPESRTFQVIQEDASQQRCIRLVSRKEFYGENKTAAIKNLPVTEATKATVAQKLQVQQQAPTRWSRLKPAVTGPAYENPQDEPLYYSDCSTDLYNRFVYHMAHTMRPRASSQKDVAELQARSNVISEVSVHKIHDDAREGALKALNTAQSDLMKGSQQREHILLRAHRQRLEGWQKASSTGVVYEQSE